MFSKKKFGENHANIDGFLCSCPYFEVQLRFCPRSFNFMILPFTFTSQCDFALGLCAFAPCFDH